MATISLRARSPFIGLLLLACTSSNEHVSKNGVPASHDSGTHADAAVIRHKIDEYLKAAVITNSDTIPPELFSCDPEWATEQSLALATYRVLEPVIHGDTAVAAAEVISVATIDQSPNEAGRYVVRIQVRIDTLHWLMTHASPGAPWGVCGWSREGYSFARGTDTTVVWLSPGGSWQAVRTLADSVQHGRSPQRDSVVRGLVVGTSHFPSMRRLENERSISTVGLMGLSAVD